MRSALLFVAVLAAPFAVAQDAVVLKRMAKDGQSAKYKLQVDTEFSGMKIKFTANVIEKVIKAFTVKRCMWESDCPFQVTDDHNYGDSINLPEGYRMGWSYIPHFISTRFYTYAYVFAHLTTLALYAQYREAGEDFVAPYLDFLSAGGSATPTDLLRPLGVDLDDPDVWEPGFAEMTRMVEVAEVVLRDDGATSSELHDFFAAHGYVLFDVAQGKPRLIDTTGHTVMPGLVESHAHLTFPSAVGHSSISACRLRSPALRSICAACQR